MASAAPVEGAVYEDRDGDGRRGLGERGIPGVLVTDGEVVVRTDRRARWSLEVEPGDFVSVVKPADWALPVDEDMLPEGTPASLGLRYQGVAPAALDGPGVRAAPVR